MLFGAALVGGVVLAAMLLLFILLGDCWAAFTTPEEIGRCEADKWYEGRVFLATVGVLWLAGIVMRLRGQAYAKELAGLAGPIGFVLWLIVF